MCPEKLAFKLPLYSNSEVREAVVDGLISILGGLRMISPSFNSCLIGHARESLRTTLECYVMQKLEAGLACWSPRVQHSGSNNYSAKSKSVMPGHM